MKAEPVGSATHTRSLATTSIVRGDCRLNPFPRRYAMTIRSWIRNLFAPRTPRTIRKVPRRRQLYGELLEDRMVPAGFYAATVDDLIRDINLANAGGGSNTITLTAPNTSPYALTTANNSTHGATG